MGQASIDPTQPELNNMSIRTSAVGRFVEHEDGAALVEYGLLIGLLSIVVVSTIVSVARFVNGAFTRAETDMAANGFTGD